MTEVFCNTCGKGFKNPGSLASHRHKIHKTVKYKLGCALFYKPIWQLTVNERGHYADSEDTFLFKIEDSPDTRLGA